MLYKTVLELSASADMGYNRIPITKDIAKTSEQNISAVILVEVEAPTVMVFMHT